ncbi:MAG: Arc family DNA-binding protein [Pseudomonadota bacterium]
MNNIANDNTHEQEQDESGRGPSMVEKFVIRLPMGLRDQIKQLSESNRRSMNSEIIMVLENHIRAQLVQQMTAVNGDGNFQVGLRGEADLDRMLETLPKEKKAALIELLG